MRLIDAYEYLRNRCITQQLDPTYPFETEDEQSKLYEGLIKSYSHEDVIASIQRITKCSVEYHKENPTELLLKFQTPIDRVAVERVVHNITVCGWFVSIINVWYPNSKSPESVKTVQEFLPTIPSLVKNATVQLVIEAKWGVDITAEIANQGTPLYHVTQTKYVERIVNQGLTPRSQAKMSTHPERIYLATSIKTAKGLIGQFTKIVGNPDWTILQIDVKAFNGVTHRLFVDPALKDEGVFTLSSISPAYITPVDLH